MTTHPSHSLNTDRPIPSVVIIGAGIGALYLAILLDNAGIPYEIFERDPEVRTIGSIMALNCNILPTFEQLDIYEEFKSISLPCKSLKIMNGEMDKILDVPTLDERLTGYDYRLLSRPKLYDFLLAKVPADKIHFSKKFVSSVESADGITVHFADGTSHHGSIVVGADGAYSAVRRELLKNLKDMNILPPADDMELDIGYSCLVGTTDPVDPEKYPFVKNRHTDQLQVIGDGTPYSWTCFNVRDNRLCYVIISQYTTVAKTENGKFSGRRWGPEHCEEMMEKVKDLQAPCGGTLGDLFNLTPREKISRVYLHDKLFETWTHGRTVLLGDSAHKLLPSAGKGAVCAMQDAVILSNCLYDLESLNIDSIKKALEDYRQQRYPHVKTLYESSQTNALFVHGQTVFEKSVRYIVFNWVPDSVMKRDWSKDPSYRPQIAFLPQAVKRGTGKILPQKPSKRYGEEMRRIEERACVRRL